MNLKNLQLCSISKALLKNTDWNKHDEHGIQSSESIVASMCVLHNCYPNDKPLGSQKALARKSCLGANSCHRIHGPGVTMLITQLFSDQIDPL